MLSSPETRRRSRRAPSLEPSSFGSTQLSGSPGPTATQSPAALGATRTQRVGPGLTLLTPHPVTPHFNGPTTLEPFRLTPAPCVSNTKPRRDRFCSSARFLSFVYPKEQNLLGCFKLEKRPYGGKSCRCCARVSCFVAEIRELCLVKKADSLTRSCVNYGKLNSVTICDSFPFC